MVKQIDEKNLEALKRRYGNLQASLEQGQQIELDSILTIYSGFMPHTKIVLTRDGTKVLSGQSELPGVSAQEYINHLLKEAPPEERPKVVEILDRQLRTHGI